MGKVEMDEGQRKSSTMYDTKRWFVVGLEFSQDFFRENDGKSAMQSQFLPILERWWIPWSTAWATGKHTHHQKHKKMLGMTNTTDEDDEDEDEDDDDDVDLDVDEEENDDDDDDDGDGDDGDHGDQDRQNNQDDGNAIMMAHPLNI